MDAHSKGPANPADSYQRELDIVTSAPRLRRPIGMGEVAAAVISVVALGGGVGLVVLHGPSRVVGVILAMTLLAVVLAWVVRLRWVPSRAPWQTIDAALAFVALGAVTLPMGTLIWPPAASDSGRVWAPSIIAAMALLAYIVARWRR